MVMNTQRHVHDDDIDIHPPDPFGIREANESILQNWDLVPVYGRAIG